MLECDGSRLFSDFMHNRCIYRILFLQYYKCAAKKNRQLFAFKFDSSSSTSFFSSQNLSCAFVFFWLISFWKAFQQFTTIWMNCLTFEECQAYEEKFNYGIKRIECELLFFVIEKKNREIRKKTIHTAKQSSWGKQKCSRTATNCGIGEIKQNKNRNSENKQNTPNFRRERFEKFNKISSYEEDYRADRPMVQRASSETPSLSGNNRESTRMNLGIGYTAYQGGYNKLFTQVCGPT